jgi:putative AlgH/UPF0301 family transcriptional regulator
VDSFCIDRLGCDPLSLHRREKICQLDFAITHHAPTSKATLWSVLLSDVNENNSPTTREPPSRIPFQARMRILRMRRRANFLLGAVTIGLLGFENVTAFAFLPRYGSSYPLPTDLSLPDVSERMRFSVHLPLPQRPLWCLQAKKSGDEEAGEEEDEDSIDLADDDWRSFRAKLVMGENGGPSSSPPTPTVVDDDLDGIGSLFTDTSAPPTAPPSAKTEIVEQEEKASLLRKMTPLDPSQWAYDSGKIIEQGAVILGGVEQDFGFGLRQQYFHKAAILVLEHQESTFTKGILLNRPTDLVLDDEVNSGVKWRVWFGGDVQGLDSDNPSIVCLHSMKSQRVVKASIPVMKDIQWTTFENAKKLVKEGAAQATDFWVFVGYAGWAPGQLMGELERQSWYMVATDSQTLLKELARQGAGADPRDAGLETWDLLMNMIGSQDTAKQHAGGFDDLMLKEWALKHLLSSEAGGGAGAQRLPPTGTTITEPLPSGGSLVQGSESSDVKVGSLVRASSADRSPFLLDNQEMHKSIVLIVADDEKLTVGAILNRPVTRGLDINISEKESGTSRRTVLPLRFGGQYSVKGDESLLWLHCSESLRLAGIGSAVGENHGGIWKCTSDDVVSAVTKGLATPEEFFVVTGVSAWSKAEDGIQGEITAGRFEVIPNSNLRTVWESLSKQEVLNQANLLRNLDAAEEAWNRGGEGLPSKEEKNGGLFPIGGIGEGFDEEDDSLVFKSDVKVSRLSDDALRTWVSTFLLGGPFTDE